MDVIGSRTSPHGEILHIPSRAMQNNGGHSGDPIRGLCDQRDGQSFPDATKRCECHQMICGLASIEYIRDISVHDSLLRESFARIV